MKKVLFVAAAIFAMVACNKENGENGGNKGTDPSTIAKESLVAYFPFDGAATETISKLEPSQKGAGVSYVKGRRGQALQGAENGYLLYETSLGSKIGSVSVAMWLNEPVRNDAPVPSFFQFIGSDFWGDICFVTDRRPDDTIAPKWFFRTYADGAPAGDKWVTTDGKYNDEYIWGSAFPASAWNHIVFTYDAATSQYNVYVNGASVLPTATNEDGALLVDPNCVKFDASALGEVKGVSDKLLINGWKQKCFDGAEDEWMGWMQGQMDELRVYNKALSAAEVLELFKAEVSQVK